MNASTLRSVYPGWWVAGGVSVIMGMVALMSVWAYGIYLAPLQAEFGWSQAMIGAGFGVTFGISGASSVLVGRLVDRYGPRKVMAVGTVGTASLYVALSQINSLAEFWAVLAVLAFFQVWVFYIPLTSLVTRWFVRRRAAAMGIATSGFGLGGLVFVPLMLVVVSLAGWRESLVLLALGTVCFNGYFLLRTSNDPNPEVRRREEVAGGGALVDKAGVVLVSGARDILRAPAFWLLTCGFSMFFLGQWAFMFHSLPYFESRGASTGEAAAIVSAATGLGVVIRLGSGVVIDRIRGREVIAAVSLVVMSATMLLLLLDGSSRALILFAVLWGLGSGVAPLLQPLLIGKLFGVRHYATAYGISDGMDTTAIIAGTWLGVALLEITGTYSMILALYALAFLAGAVSLTALALALRRPGGTSVHRTSTNWEMIGG